MFIRRPRLENALIHDKILLYGRYATGKTTYALYKKEGWGYALVRSKKKVVFEGKPMDLKYFIRHLPKVDEIIIDEFHRMEYPQEDLIYKLPERVVLITSSSRLLDEMGHIVDAFGIENKQDVGLISPQEVLRYGEALEDAIFWREPAFVGRNIEEILIMGKWFTLGLITKAGCEDNIYISRRLLRILEIISGENLTPTQIAQALADSGEVKWSATGFVKPYLQRSLEAHLLERLPIPGVRKVVYRHLSPVTDLIFYLNKKLSYFEKPTDKGILIKFYEEKKNYFIGRFVEDLLAELWGMEKVWIPGSDISLRSSDGIKFIGKVLWNGAHLETIIEVEKKFEDIEKRYGPIEEKAIITRDASLLPETELRIIDEEHIRSLID